MTVTIRTKTCKRVIQSTGSSFLKYVGSFQVAPHLPPLQYFACRLIVCKPETES